MINITKEQFAEILTKPEPLDGWEWHLKYLWETNNAKSIFKLTGLDFTEMFSIKPTGGMKI